jgi:AraC-like DNA-binding protein
MKSSFQIAFQGCGFLKVFQTVGNKRSKRKKNFESSMIRLISSLLVVLFLSVIVLYYSVMQGMYSEQLKKSNDSIIEQVGISYEMIMKQITDGIYKIPLYDTEMIGMIRDSAPDMLYQIGLQHKLDSIILGNNYLYSAYLYIPAQNIVYSSERANSYPLDAFPDLEAIVLKSKGNISILDPRLVSTLQGNKLLISVVSPIPLYQGDYEGLLVVNIDANKLYYDILNRIKTEKNMNFYVYNKNNVIIINKDGSPLFAQLTPTRQKEDSGHQSPNLHISIFNKKIIHSEYYSKDLKWTFVLDTSMQSASSFLAKLYSIGLVLLGLLMLGLIVVIRIVKISAKPMKKALSGYNEKLWADFLTGNEAQTADLYVQLESDMANFRCDTYAVIVLQLARTDMLAKGFIPYLAGIKSGIAAKNSVCSAIAVPVYKSQLAIVVNYEPKADNEDTDSLLSGFAKRVYDHLEPELKQLTYISISTLKKNIQMLPVSYMECVDAQSFRIACGGSRILFCSAIKRNTADHSYEYPLEIENQLINNIMVGNPEACETFLGKFYATLSETEYPLPDSEIKNCIYQLQNSILRSVSNLPITVKVDNTMNILNLYDFNDIRTQVSDFVVKTANEIKKSSEDKDSNLLRSIFDYIDRNFMNTDFNLNGAADELGLNRNYLTKLVKEKSGDSFNEYVTKKRIAMAKALLHEKNTPIEDIAHKTGFSYSHYFIKVFKAQEGITPGQYRDKVIDTLA